MTAAAADFLADLWAGRLARRARDAEGRPLCECGLLIGATQLECDACARQLAQHERKQKELALRARLDEKAARGFLDVPQWERARHDSPLFVERVKDKRLHAAAKKYSTDHGNLVLLGPTGVGKTSTAIAMIWRIRREATAACYATRSEKPLHFVSRMRWTTAADLVRARREHPFGSGEAPAVERAIRASLLVMDDLGQERDDTVVFEILDRLYTENRSVIVTAGMRPDDLRARYGEAAWRRLSERGVVIDTWGE